MMISRNKIILTVFIGLLMVCGCADALPVEYAQTVTPVGFLYGFWHGFIYLFAFIGSLFNDNIAVYATYNTGGWYDFGYLLGLGVYIRS